MALRTTLLAAVLGVPAHGEPVNLRMANCRMGLVRLSGADPFTVAALCRSTLPSDVCREATRELGQQPWTSDKMESVCQRWEHVWAPRMPSKARELDSIADAKGANTASVDGATGGKTSATRNPWQEPLSGINPYTSPMIVTPPAQPVMTLDTLPDPLPPSISPQDILGVLKLNATQAALITHATAFGPAVHEVVTKTAKVPPYMMKTTSVRISPAFVNGVITSAGGVEVFFKLAGIDYENLGTISERLNKAPAKALGYMLWSCLAKAGSNGHTFIFEGLSTRIAGAAPHSKNKAPTLTAGKPNQHPPASKAVPQSENKAPTWTAGKPSQPKLPTSEAAKAFESLLGHRSKVPKKGLVVENEVHENRVVAKDQVLRVSWATGLVGGAVLCTMAVLMTTKVWRRHTASQRNIHHALKTKVDLEPEMYRMEAQAGLAHTGGAGTE